MRVSDRTPAPTRADTVNERGDKVSPSFQQTVLSKQAEIQRVVWYFKP